MIQKNSKEYAHSSNAFPLIFLLASLVISFISCTSAGSGEEKRKAELQKEVQKTALAITGFMDERNKIYQMQLEKYQDLFKKADWSDIDISGMDISEGGEFFESGVGTQYSRNIRADIPVDYDRIMVTTLGMKEVTGETKQKLLWMVENLEPPIVQTFKELPYQSAHRIIIDDMIILYPVLDFRSALEMRTIDYTGLAWYKLYTTYKTTTWTVALIGTSEGIVHQNVAGIRVDNRPIGICLNSLNIGALFKDIFADRESIIFIMYDDLTIYGASEKAREFFKFKVLDDWDYLRASGFLPDTIPPEYRLDSSAGTPGTLALADLFKANIHKTGKKTFPATINDKNYLVYAERVDRGTSTVAKTGYYVIGLTEGGEGAESPVKRKFITGKNIPSFSFEYPPDFEERPQVFHSHTAQFAAPNKYSVPNLTVDITTADSSEENPGLEDLPELTIQYWKQTFPQNFGYKIYENKLIELSGGQKAVSYKFRCFYLYEQTEFPCDVAIVQTIYQDTLITLTYFSVGGYSSADQGMRYCRSLRLEP